MRRLSSNSNPTARPTTQPTVDVHPHEALFASLVDDAAVFPPGNTPLAEAVHRHRDHRDSWYAPLVGPLLIPVSAAAALEAALAGGPACRVGVIARDGTPLADLAAAITRLRAADAVRLVGVELGWTPLWREIDVAGLPLSLEVPRGAAMATAVGDIASDTAPAQAKFRTGATETRAWPDEAELAAFLRTTIEHGVRFKLTGGLHHILRADNDGDAQHGLLNVIAAVHRALRGASERELVTVLADRDPSTVTALVTDMSGADAAAVRAHFLSYGCCDVTDPIRELAAARLVEEN